MKREEIPDRQPGSVWTLRWPLVKVGQTNGSVRTLPDDYIGIGTWGDYRVGPQTLVLSRKDARLLAKRINQCLDRTAKK
jgi:hypothetical protein